MLKKALSIGDHLQKKYLSNTHENKNEIYKEEEDPTNNLDQEEINSNYSKNHNKNTTQRLQDNNNTNNFNSYDPHMEIRPLQLINPKAGQLNGVKGVFIKDYSIFSNMFQWNTKCVLGIFAADQNGKLFSNNQKPILYAVAKLKSKCSCDYFDLTDFAITTKLNQKESDGPFIFMKENQACCKHNTCSIFINDNGNQTSLGQIQRGFRKCISLTNGYVKNLEISLPFCICSWSQIKYNVSDAQNNKASLIEEKNFCSCKNSVNFRLGFPPAYNENQNTILVAMVVYFAFLSKSIDCMDRI